MATVKQKIEGKSMFLKEYLMENPAAGAEAVAAAWREAGNEGTISASLVGKVRRDLELTGGLPEFEELLRKARRILVRSHVE